MLSFNRLEWLACLVKFQFKLKLCSQRRIGLRFGQAQSVLRRFRCFGKPPGFGQGGGKGVENDRVFSAGQLIGLLGQFHRVAAFA